MADLKKINPEVAKDTVLETEWFKNLLDVEDSEEPIAFEEYMKTLFNLECIDYDQLLEACVRYNCNNFHIKI